ncbi:MAG: succinate dehydrogenase cytochrome b subunit [Acidobacteria bacterium]|nr:succinate dehydrogenase cytochrome b subunit [Acidobacteriota bacterium]
MATAAAPNSKLQQSLALYQSTIGKKYVVAITGAVLFAFTIGHMLGNLQIYLPNAEEALMTYAKLLHASAELLWAIRIALLTCFVLHVVTIAQLYNVNRAARPQAYIKKTPTISSYASRTMYFSGPILFFFVLIIAMSMLGLHLTHGVWSMFQSVGFNHPRYTQTLRTFATAAAAVISLGNISIPVCVLLGIIGKDLV